MTKIQNSKHNWYEPKHFCFGYWILIFVIYLKFGAWDLEFVGYPIILMR